jgi:hypothetical protein
MLADCRHRTAKNWVFGDANSAGALHVQCETLTQNPTRDDELSNVTILAHFAGKATGWANRPFYLAGRAFATVL